jgi:hypothetical protein
MATRTISSNASDLKKKFESLSKPRVYNTRLSHSASQKLESKKNAITESDYQPFNAGEGSVDPDFVLSMDENKGPIQNTSSIANDLTSRTPHVTKLKSQAPLQATSVNLSKSDRDKTSSTWGNNHKTMLSADPGNASAAKSSFQDRLRAKADAVIQRSNEISRETQALNDQKRRSFDQLLDTYP